MINSFGAQLFAVPARFGNQTVKLGVEQSLVYAYIEPPTEPPRDEWMFTPPPLFGLIVWLQLCRHTRYPVPPLLAT